MKNPYRFLAEGQRCQVWIHDTSSGENRMILETTDLLLEAPNWTLQGDALILNGNGLLWRMPMDEPALLRIDLHGVPPLNKDHVLDPDGAHIFVSAYDDWQLYRAPLSGGAAIQISGKEGPEGLLHFLHGVSPDGKQLAFVGVKAKIPRTASPSCPPRSALAAEGTTFARSPLEVRQRTGRNTAPTVPGSTSAPRPFRAMPRSPACDPTGPRDPPDRRHRELVPASVAGRSRLRPIWHTRPEPKGILPTSGWT